MSATLNQIIDAVSRAPIYTLGYTGRKPTQIVDIVKQLDARLIDIRYSATSRHRRWTESGMVGWLGAAYYHVVTLGNKTYREGRIEIANMDAGLDWIDGYQRGHPQQPLILMCACKDFMTCHRRVVSLELVKRGWQVPIELIDHKKTSKRPTFNIGQYVFDLPEWC